MSEQDTDILFLASIAPTEGGLRIHGIDGYRVLLDVPDDELAAVMRLALMRGKVLEVRVREKGMKPAKPAKKAKKASVPEWGDDDGTEAHGDT